MKKVLFATTAIVLTAGAAAAQNVTISGTGRVGLLYQENRGVGQNDTQVNNRLRFNFDARKETDSGVVFGGRIRMQYDSNYNGLAGIPPTAGVQPVSSGARLSAAYVYAEYAGLRVEVGNANTAFDSVALLYNSEIGYIGQTFGSYNNQSYYSFATNPYGPGEQNRMGVYAAYSFAGANLKMSYITPDQAASTLPVGRNEEFSMAADYTFGAITLAGAFALNGSGIDNNDVYFLGGEYAFNDVGAVGLHVNYTDFGAPGDETTVTLYGNYKFGAITARAYVANYDSIGVNPTDTVYGIGADYDLGGATLAGHVARDNNEDIQASLGVKFSF
ncbi:porin [Oceaniglobus roseus]|uniref:porin n=1 Tax=Oceaniglobus roseus TaxID=1737570 RepID=UPI000C7F169D|nr:porin [Kandeliimicrobium roseum]